MTATQILKAAFHHFRGWELTKDASERYLDILESGVKSGEVSIRGALAAATMLGIQLEKANR